MAELKTKVKYWKDQHAIKARAAGWAILEKDMAQMYKYQQQDPARFFAGTGMQMRSDQLDVAFSDEELAEKLVKAEKNYYLKGPQLKRSDFDQIVPDNQFVIPYDVDSLLEEMQDLKKVDAFYKRYRKSLAPSLAAIAYAVSKSNLFPSECKIMKLCFLKSRTNF